MRKRRKNSRKSDRPLGTQKCKLAKGKKGSYTPPEYKAMKTKGISLFGRISLKQYFLLVEHGYDGDTVRKWTKNRAYQEIDKLVIRDRKPIPQAPAIKQIEAKPRHHTPKTAIDWDAVLGIEDSSRE